MIDFSELALSPNESRAARNYLGLSQAQAAIKSNLPAHKLKRFETGNYVPDGEFLQNLREFYEGQGYNFHDEDAPGAKAKARGDVFPAGVLGKPAGDDGETAGSPSENQGKPRRMQPANVQYMRITPTLSSDQIDRILETVDDNINAIKDEAGTKVDRPLFTSYPDDEGQAHAISLLRRLAENGLLQARLLGHDLMPAPHATEDLTVANANTVGELLDLAMKDMHRAVIDGDAEAAARRKGRAKPIGVSWLVTDMQLIERQGQKLPVDFSPVRADPRRCESLVRERPAFNYERGLLHLAA